MSQGAVEHGWGREGRRDAVWVPTNAALGLMASTLSNPGEKQAFSTSQAKEYNVESTAGDPQMSKGKILHFSSDSSPDLGEVGTRKATLPLPQLGSSSACIGDPFFCS